MPINPPSATMHRAPPASSSLHAQQAAVSLTRPAAHTPTCPAQPSDPMGIDQQLPARTTCNSAAKVAVISGSSKPSSSKPISPQPPASGGTNPDIHAAQSPKAQQQQQQEEEEEKPQRAGPAHHKPSPEDQPQQQQQEIATLPSHRSVPYHLLHLCSNYQNQTLKPTEHLVVAVHAAMLESGFVTLSTQSLVCSMSLATPAAEAVPGAAAASGASASWQLPKAVGGICTLQYSYASSGRTNMASSNSSSAHATPAAAAAGGAHACTCVVKVLDMGVHAVVVGVLNTAAGMIQLTAGPSSSSFSSTAAAAGSSTSSASLQVVQTVTVPLKQYINRTRIPSASAASAARPAAAAAGAAGCGDVLLLSPYRNLSELWVLLKDQVSLPLLISCCRHLGDSPPFGLTAMPWEMQEAVLKKLKVGRAGKISRWGWVYGSTGCEGGCCGRGCVQCVHFEAVESAGRQVSSLLTGRGRISVGAYRCSRDQN